MLIFGGTKVTKEEFYGNKIKLLDVNVNNVIFSKLVETKNSSKYLNC